MTLKTQGLQPWSKSAPSPKAAISASGAARRLNQARTELFRSINNAQKPAA